MIENSFFFFFQKSHQFKCFILLNRNFPQIDDNGIFFQMKRKGHVVKEEPDSSPGKKFCRDGDYQR